MANYLILLRLPGKIDFPDDADMAQLESINLVQPRMQRNEFELLRVVPCSPSEISDPSIYENQASEDTVILEAKMRLTDKEIQLPNKILQKITLAMQRGRMHLERLQNNEAQAAPSIVTISELNRHNRYIVNFHYPKILASVTHDSAENVIANEVLQLLQGGEMAL